MAALFLLHTRRFPTIPAQFRSFPLELAAGSPRSLGGMKTIIRKQGDAQMARLASTAIVLVLALAAGSAQAQQRPAQGTQAGPPAQILSSVPQNAMTVTHWYKQNVYDHSDNKIGEVMDVLVDRDGRIGAFIVGVGGFLGAGEKDVAVPFNAVQVTKKDNKDYLVMNSTKDALKNAKGFKYDRTNMTWLPEEQQPATTGTPAAPAQRPAPRQ
jgi:sporulation protein YlmC with PRC-barrel domain